MHRHYEGRHYTPKPMDYVVKDARVQAVKFDEDNINIVAAWCGGLVEEESLALNSSGKQTILLVPTLHGIKYVYIGDWIVKDARSRVHIFKEIEFKDTFEFVPKTKSIFGKDENTRRENS